MHQFFLLHFSYTYSRVEKELAESGMTVAPPPRSRQSSAAMPPPLTLPPPARERRAVVEDAASLQVVTPQDAAVSQGIKPQDAAAVPAATPQDATQGGDVDINSDENDTNWEDVGDATVVIEKAVVSAAGDDIDHSKKQEV
jgi:hypothetical protein